MAVVEAVGVNLAIGITAFALRAVRLSGFLGGVVLGSLIYLGAGRAGFAVLVGFFVLGTLVTRLGYATKAARGVAEEAGGRRGVSHTLANGSMGLLLAALLALGRTLEWQETVLPLRMAYAAAFATALADTTSSEIGGLWGRHPVSLKTFRPVPVGTEGAVSLEGTSAGSAAALILAILAWGIGWLEGGGVVAVAVITLAATAGNLGESVAASWGLKKRGHHQLLNFMNTAAGAAIAFLVGVLGGLGS